MALAQISSGQKYRRSFKLTALSLAIFLSVLVGQLAHAATLTNRQIQISSPLPLASSAQNFQFTYATASTIGSLSFEYCDNSPLFADSCNAPTGLNAASATLTSQSGNAGFSFDTVNTTANKIVLTRVPTGALAIASTYNFGNVINPSATGTVFVRISTYSTANASGLPTDIGAVAFAILQPFNINTFVPPYLRLCVAITVAPDCSTATGDSIDLGLLTPTAAKTGQSQFSAGTNSITGYAVYSLGTTMTSGNNIITALASPSPSLPGNSQFGINLRANSSPLVGQDPAGPGSATPTGSYNIPNFFMFQPDDQISGENQPTDFNQMTVSYLVNVNSGQPPGVYNTTITYLAVAQF